MFPTVSYSATANRFAPFADYVDIVGFDFTGATTKLQVRDRKNGGAVRADVVPAISVTVNEGLPTTRISWAIDEVAMEAMPLDSGDPDADVVLFHDLHLTPSGGTKFIPFAGTFTVKAGVTE